MVPDIRNAVRRFTASGRLRRAASDGNTLVSANHRANHRADDGPDGRRDGGPELPGIHLLLLGQSRNVGDQLR
jgi:hypothetical protein